MHYSVHFLAPKLSLIACTFYNVPTSLQIKNEWQEFQLSSETVTIIYVLAKCATERRSLKAR